MKSGFDIRNCEVWGDGFLTDMGEISCGPAFRRQLDEGDETVKSAITAAAGAIAYARWMSGQDLGSTP